MNQSVFEQQAFDLITNILEKTPNTLVVDTRQGFDVFDKSGTKIFGITVIDLYAVIYIKGAVHSLSFERASAIYDKCRQKYDSQPKPEIVKEQKRLLQNMEQNSSLAYLKRVAALSIQK